jgi:mannan endo-1,6-alpha-mannosidase
MHILQICTIVCMFLFNASAITLNTDESQSILEAASAAAAGLQALYNGNSPDGVVGKWPYPPYYWWESGAAWGGMVGK